MKHLLISHPEKCIGCGTCELACSLKHNDLFRPSLSNIRVYRLDHDGENLPVSCFQCEDAPCMEACKFGALTRNSATDNVDLHKDKCVGCGMCARACPFKSIAVDRGVRKAYKCNQCDGAPQCVEYCPAGALEYLPDTSESAPLQATFSDKMRHFFAEVK